MCIWVLASESNASSLGGWKKDEASGDFFRLDIRALTLLQRFDTVRWMTGRTS